jgi:hypothetical protein
LSEVREKSLAMTAPDRQHDVSHSMLLHTTTKASNGVELPSPTQHQRHRPWSPMRPSEPSALPPGWLSPVIASPASLCDGRSLPFSVSSSALASPPLTPRLFRVRMISHEEMWGKVEGRRPKKTIPAANKFSQRLTVSRSSSNLGLEGGNARVRKTRAGPSFASRWGMRHHSDQSGTLACEQARARFQTQTKGTP